MIEYGKFAKALKHLEKQYNNYLSMNERDTLSELDREGIRESVIQRFETCYDTMWKHLKKYLEKEIGLPDIPNSPKPILRIAYENKIINNIEEWFEHANSRVNTSHDYSEEKLNSALSKTGDFIHDAVVLYEVIAKETWIWESGE